ncbi:MAG: hypothetical protein KatS3mg002_0643 [Candidatus Woesearchaeota archaeon]|nr:MAG: hypothetical protein KatS3mg002_0643 [Candidatus Woesearchaeota archaeon]
MIKNNNENKKPNISINNPINKSINYITGNTISGDTKTKIDTTKGILYESKNERLKKYSLIGIIIIIATTIIYFSYIIIFKNTSKDL